MELYEDGIIIPATSEDNIKKIFTWWWKTVIQTGRTDGEITSVNVYRQESNIT